MHPQTTVDGKRCMILCERLQFQSWYRLSTTIQFLLHTACYLQMHNNLSEGSLLFTHIRQWFIVYIVATHSAFIRYPSARFFFPQGRKEKERRYQRVVWPVKVSFYLAPHISSFGGSIEYHLVRWIMGRWMVRPSDLSKHISLHTCSPWLQPIWKLR